MAAKETQTQKIKRLSKNKEQIRNIATSAHIHHGKTALTDTLLAAAGMMSAKAAGDLDEGMACGRRRTTLAAGYAACG